jgi:hypothetical protein
MWSPFFVETATDLLKPTVPKQGIGIRITTSEITEDIHWMSATPLSQNCVSKTPPRFHDRFLIIKSSILEGSKRISTQNFSPLVTVVASRIAARKNVLE